MSFGTAQALLLAGPPGLVSRSQDVAVMTPFRGKPAALQNNCRAPATSAFFHYHSLSHLQVKHERSCFKPVFISLFIRANSSLCFFTVEGETKAHYFTIFLQQVVRNI